MAHKMLLAVYCSPEVLNPPPAEKVIHVEHSPQWT